jgi:hypothetical protein
LPQLYESMVTQQVRHLCLPHRFFSLCFHSRIAFLVINDNDKSRARPCLLRSLTDPSSSTHPCVAHPQDGLCSPYRPCSDGLRCAAHRRPPPHGTDSACAARSPSELTPPVATALHPLAAPTAEVHVTNDLRTRNLRGLRGIELRAGVELHKDELHSSKRCVESTCYKRMLRVFQRYVASVLYGCCKSKSGCCICYNGCTLML